jgi:acetyl esterase/lipase
MRLQVTLLIIFIITFSACKKSDSNTQTPTNPTPTPLAASTTNDVSYGAGGSQKMDVFLPAGRTTASTKVLILIHGGGWVIGDKADLNGFISNIKLRLPDYAIFNINYTLANSLISNAFPTQENDVKAAVDFIYANRNNYSVSDKIALLGISAGAHLSLLQAYKNTTPKIKAVVDLYGPTDMVDMHNNPPSSIVNPLFIRWIVTGSSFGFPAANPNAYTSSSPLSQVNAVSPPTIIFQGGLDTLVRPSQSANLAAKLSQNNVANQYVFYPSEGHAYLGASLDDTFNKTVAFLNVHVQ